MDDGAFWLPDEVAEGIVRPLAFVVAPTLSARAIITALRTQLEAAFVPRRVVHVQAFPREATGKLTVSALRRFALQTLADLDGDTVIDIPPDHPAFAGHFPGHPVLPGVVLLALVMQALAARPALAELVGPTPQISNAKFLQPVGPGTRLRIALKEQGTGVAFEVLNGDTAVARGQLA